MANSVLCVKNINVYGNVDYGQPIYPSFSDYRTSTKRALRYMQNPPHNPVLLRNCPLTASRCKSTGLRRKTNYDIDFTKKSTCQNEYSKSGVGKVSRQEIGPAASNIHYMRRLKERVFDDPPRPMNNMITEHQRQYKLNYFPKSSPIPKQNFTLQSEKADPSFQFRSNQPGYSRYLDPYASTSELSYIPYTKDDQNGIAKKDIITFYDLLSGPKGARGSGPRVKTHVKADTFKPVQDKAVFKNKCYQRIVPFTMFRVPNSGMTTEIKSNYSGRTMTPFNLDACKAPPVHQSPWQDLSSPYMYCTEYCHIAHKTPVDCIVDVYGKL